jgi:hypothetical protein
MHNWRTWRTIMSWIVVVGVVGSVAVAAILADGRTGSASRTNDGGAWLLNRSGDSIGHVNRVVGEVATVAGPFSGRFDVAQSDNVVVVDDRGAGEAVLIDTNLGAPGAPVPISLETSVHAAPDVVVLFERSTGRLWRFHRSEFGAVGSLDDHVPLVQAQPGSLLAVGREGTLAVAEADGASVQLWRPDDDDAGVERVILRDTIEPDTDGIEVVAENDPPTDVTLVGDTAVVTTEAGDLVVADADAAEPVIHRVGPVVNLQQPGDGASNVVVVRQDGSMETVNLATGDANVVADARSDPSIAPIVHDGCVWSVALAPATFHYCGRQHDLGTGATDIKLTLVNGWVWVNDVDQGGIWFVQEDDLEVTEISDWTAALRRTDETEVVEEADGGEEETVNDPDAEELEDDVDALDDDEENTPPVAEDDEAATRLGRPVVVHVLANDHDEDNDPLSVDELANVDADGFTAEGALVRVTADQSALNVTPPVDFTGTITFGYVVHDGRQGRDDATVSVDVTEPDEATNRPPVTEIDNATVRAGKFVGLNVLANDHDPDGDVLVLTAADDLEGTVNYTPDGELTFAPDAASPEGTVDISYTVADDFGVEATGTARIRVRQPESNLPPEARNDVGHTSVGHSVIVDVLANDYDPDGDPLIPQNLQTIDGSSTSAQLSLTGEFVFRPEAPGTYRFTYAASDGPDTDVAQIRIEVDPETDNRPPVAVVDEVALAIGESRLVRVLDNDGDPDGDVVGLVDWVGADGLDVTEVPGVGFNVMATPSASTRTEFRYWISDGVAEPVMGSVVVSAVARDAVDYPPIAVADIVDARAGTTTELFVLRNDHDPEGKLIEVVAPVVQPAEALVRVSPDRQSVLLRVDPAARFSFQFSYDIQDPAGNRASAVVEVRIVPPDQPNRAPVAGPDVATTPHATPVSIPVLRNDLDPDGDAINVESIAEQPTHGTVEISEDGTLLYRPADGFSGTDRLVYTLVDGYLPPTDANGTPIGDDAGPGRDLGEVLIGVMPESAANRPPVAVDDDAFAPVAIGRAAVELAVLANDSDPDSDPISITATTTPPVGSLKISSDRRGLSYTPPTTAEQDVVSFAYTISDGRGGTATAQVTLDIDLDPDPLPPVAVDDKIGPIVARSTVVIDPRVNDLDPDGDADLLTIESADPALTLLPDGRVELTAPVETSEIEYLVRDEQGLASEPAFITVLVAPNRAPVVTPLTVETPFGTPVSIDVHDAVTDPDGDPLVITLGAKRNGGSVRAVDSGDSTLSVEFTPDTDFSGQATFDFTVDDREGHTVTGTVQVTVTPPANREPVAEAATITTDAGIDAVVRLGDLVTDPDGPDNHRYEVSDVTGPIDVSAPNGRGEVVIGSAVTDGGSSGAFTYTVVDADAGSASHRVSNTVTIELAVPNFPPPTIGADSARVTQGNPTDPIPLLANDVDNSPPGLRGEGLAVTAIGVTDAGTTERVGDAVVFRPSPDFFGRASFTYTVQDGRRSAAGESSGTVTVDVVGRPATPQAPTVSAVGNQYVVVGWRAPQGDAARAPVTGYRLSYTASDGTTGGQVFDQPTLSYRWDGLDNAVEYCFQVSAINEAGEGDPSAPGGAQSCGVPDVRPEAPAAPSVQFGDGELRISWNEPLNAGSPIRTYQLRISGGLDAVSPELGTATSYTWTDLQNGTDYTFEVRARNGAIEQDGWSDWSGFSVREHPLTLPDAPAAPSAERGDRQVVVTWSAPYDGGDAIQRYELQSSIDPRWVSVTPQGATNSHVWRDIPNGTDVSFRVRAVNRDPRSTTPGNISSGSPTVRTCDVPDPPGQPSVVRGDRQVTVSWQPPGDQGCAISEYRIDNGAGAVQTAPAGATSHVFTGLTNGTAYRFSVTAVNEVVTVDGKAPKPSAASAAVTPAGAPFATDVTDASNVGPAQVRVRWSTPDDNGAPIIDYQMSVNDSPWTSVGLQNATTYNGRDGTTYTFRVRAINDVGPGAPGASGSVTTWTTPGTPNVDASASQNGGRTVTASWNRPANGGTEIDGHQARLTTGDCTSGPIRDNPGSPATWNDVTNGTQYRVCVRYHNAVGWGSWGSSNAVTPRQPPPPPPTINVYKGATYQGTNGTCSPGECAHIDFEMNNFQPNTTYNWNIDTSNGSWGNPRSVTTNGSGDARKAGDSWPVGSGSGWPIYGHNYGWVEVCVNGVCDRTNF